MRQKQIHLCRPTSSVIHLCDEAGELTVNRQARQEI